MSRPDARPEARPEARSGAQAESRSERLTALRAALGEGTGTQTGSATRRPVLTFGVEAVDAALPGGGLAAGSHEVCAGGADLPHEAAMVQLAAYLLGRGRGPVIWALPRLTLFPPALAEAGLSPSRVIYAEGGREADVLAVAEEALRHGGLAGVVCEADRLSLTASRRLQLAGEAGGVPALVLRRWRRGAAPAAGTACATRWTVTPRPSACPSGLPRAAWSLALTRCRGGRPAAWSVFLETAREGREGRGADAPLRLCLAGELAGGQADARGLAAGGQRAA